MRLLRPEEIPCQQVVELISDYLEGALPARSRRRLEFHLAGCPHCSAYLAQMRTTIWAVGRLGERTASPTIMDALLEAFRDWKLSGA